MSTSQGGTLSPGIRLGGLQTLLAFARPHTLIGTSLSVAALFALVPELWLEPSSLGLLVATWLSCVGANLYIVGLNQLFDIEIDRINKPHLPLVSGALTVAQGWWAVAVAGALGLGLAVSQLQGGYLVATVVASMLLGTLYSAPPARWKRFPALAVLCIFAVRGPVVNIGLFLHFRRAAGGPVQVTPEVWGLTLFMVALGVVIALFKDIPDTDGDRQFRIGTYALRFGRATVFRVSQGILTAAYLGFAAAAALWMPRVSLPLFVAYQIAAIACLWAAGRGMRAGAPENWLRPRYRTYYRTVWRLFYLQYLVFPLACALGQR